MKLSSFHLFGKTFCSPPLKFSTCCKVGSRVLDSRYYVENYQRKRVACYCYQKLRQTNFSKKNFGKCSQIGCFKVRNLTRKTLTLRQSHSNYMLHGEITEKSTRASRRYHGNLAHESPRGNMHNLFDCISTPLKRFLACLTFHREEILLRHLHKRTNTGSGPEVCFGTQPN